MRKLFRLFDSPIPPLLLFLHHYLLFFPHFFLFLSRHPRRIRSRHHGAYVYIDELSDQFILANFRALRTLVRYGRSSRGWLLACDSLPCWRKAHCKTMVRHRFRGLLPFCLCLQASRQKGRRGEIGSPSWLCTVAHHAAQPPRASRPPLSSLLSSPLNRR